VTLTEAGVLLAKSVATGFASIDSGLAAARGLADDRRGRIILACVPSLSASRLPDILATWRAADKTTRIDVEELTSSEVVAALIAETVDFGVGPCIDPPPPEIAFTAAVNEPLVVLLPRDAETGGPDGVPFATLAGLALVTLSGSVLLQQTLERAAREHGLRLVSHAEVRHVQTAVAMARAGLGAAIVPRLALPDDLADLRIARIIDPPVSRAVGIITRRGKPLGKTAARLARHVRSALVRAMDEIDEQIERV
jgi:DNA-binding transcriptional LysR family regulator